MADTSLDDIITGPRSAERLIGHEAQQAAFLQSLHNNTLHHAWLLTGPQGIGKATFAWLAAKHVLTASTDEAGDSLFGDAPPAATKFSASLENPEIHRISIGGHADLRVLSIEENPKTKKMRTEIIIDQVQALHSLFGMSSGEGGWRVVIIDSVDDLNRNAANALLKMLEEPPANCLFFLVSHRPGRLLPTIKSRCRLLGFKRLTDEQLEDYLASIGKNGDTLIRDLASGSPGRALQLLDMNANRVAADMTSLLKDMPPITPQLIKPYQSSDEATALALEFLDSILCGAAGAHTPMPFREAASMLAQKTSGETLDKLSQDLRQMSAQQAGLRMDRGFFWLAVGETLRNRLGSG